MKHHKPIQIQIYYSDQTSDVIRLKPNGTYEVEHFHSGQDLEFHKVEEKNE